MDTIPKTQEQWREYVLNNFIFTSPEDNNGKSITSIHCPICKRTTNTTMKTDSKYGLADMVVSHIISKHFEDIKMD